MGSINVPITVDRSSACKTIMAQKSQMKRMFVLVLGEDVASASTFATSLIEYNIPFVLVVGEPANVLFQISDSSIIVVDKKKKKKTVEWK